MILDCMSQYQGEGVISNEFLLPLINFRIEKAINKPNNNIFIKRKGNGSDQPLFNKLYS